MTVKLLTEHHLDFLCLKGGYTGSSQSTLVKIPHCWKSHVATHLMFLLVISAAGSSGGNEHSFTPVELVLKSKLPIIGPVKQTFLA